MLPAVEGASGLPSRPPVILERGQEPEREPARGCCIEDGDPAYLIGVLAEIRRTRRDPARNVIARVRNHLLDVPIEGAVRVGEASHGGVQENFKKNSRSRDLLPCVESRQRGQFCVVERMRPDLKSGLVQFDDVPALHQGRLRQGEGAIPEIRGDALITENENHRPCSKFLQQGKRNIVGIAIAVVEGEYHRLPGQIQLALSIERVIVECDRSEPPPVEEFELLLKFTDVDARPVRLAEGFLFDDAVIHQHLDDPGIHPVARERASAHRPVPFLPATAAAGDVRGSGCTVPPALR